MEEYKKLRESMDRMQIQRQPEQNAAAHQQAAVVTHETHEHPPLTHKEEHVEEAHHDTESRVMSEMDVFCRS